MTNETKNDYEPYEMIKYKSTRKRRSQHDVQILEKTFEIIKIPSNVLIDELYYKLEGDWTLKEIQKWFNNRREKEKKRKIPIINSSIIHKKKRLVTSDFEKKILKDAYDDNGLLNENTILSVQQIIGWTRRRIIQYRTNLDKLVKKLHINTTI
jgi:hypothetical protein